MLQKLLFKIAKGPFMGKIIGYAFQYCSWAMPVKKVSDSLDVLAFYHPQPSYDHHIIISLKRAVPSLRELTSGGFVSIWEAVKELHTAHPAYHDSFTLVANGGIRQEVQQVHFHMIANHKMANDYAAQSAEKMVYHDQDICILEHPNPNWEIHLVMKPATSSRSAPEAYFKSVLNSISQLNTEFHLEQKGYSLVYQYKKQNRPMNDPVFHLIAGQQLAKPS